ncbi:hypothetical protein KUV85_02035 [Nocardioides panacisoli]|uniref:hypothetical protein n=1 Tax=Nocardioides panacisoli TaxID=627624 RepID=UPI001C639DBB|nr:hypothetical protein [Nocardioides panacisoli]QYJ04482.1 hypothetical protein KUV85_02035 [Nocardioides panacisoli]
MSGPAADTAPRPPGRLGEALDVEDVRRYLADLTDWLHARRTELEQLDAHALATDRGAEITADMSLALASWKAIDDRHQLALATFDGGRVTVTDRERLAALLWGRLDGANVDMPGGLAVSLLEACRLNDALTGQLRARLAVAPGEAATTTRLADLRAQLVRIEDQVALEPEESREAEVARLAGLLARLEDVSDRARRGGDVGGLLAPLEVEVATHERDLIVGHAERRDTRDRARATLELRDDLVARAAALERLAARCAATVDTAPHYAVPDVDALGPVPQDPAGLQEHRRRLDRVSEALEWAQDRYAAALGEHHDLLAELDDRAEAARAAGLGGHADLDAAERVAREVLDRRPAPMALARQLVATHRAWLEHLTTDGVSGL